MALCASCAPAEQPVQVSAIEVRLRTPADERDLVAMLQRVAAAGGLHVDDSSARWREFQKEANSPAAARMSVRISVWNGPEDRDIEISVSDMGHIGRAWIAFINYGKSDMAPELRAQLIAAIKRRWPDALMVPVMPTGALPLASHLLRTPSGYKVVRSAAKTYDLPPDSPLLAP